MPCRGKSRKGFDALWIPGDAMLEGYDGEYRGVYLNAELQDDENLQRWKRVLIKLLNSAEFSVRSVAIDLFVTLVGEIFDEYGCIDSFTFLS